VARISARAIIDYRHMRMYIRALIRAFRRK
jgi:hypothetical protein